MRKRDKREKKNDEDEQRDARLMYAKRLRRIANALSERERNKSRLIKKKKNNTAVNKKLNNNKNVRRYGRRGVTPRCRRAYGRRLWRAWVSSSLGIKRKTQQKKKSAMTTLRTSFERRYAFERAKRSLAKGAHVAVSAGAHRKGPRPASVGGLSTGSVDPGPGEKLYVART